VKLFIFCLILLVIYCLGCTSNNKNDLCKYEFEKIFSSDTPSMASKIIDDTIVEVSDKILDSSFITKGIYVFDKKMHLRSYSFFVNDSNYRYSEEYDSNGFLINTEGTPLLEYRIWKKSSDTILFNVSLFALNKKYENIEIITNNGDTIRPVYLFKSNLYSNVKCFSFKLKLLNGISNLICYASGTFQNNCSLQKNDFIDTTNFIDVKFHNGKFEGPNP
jgi:hypothetical protein